jgi:hypothetical protein
MHLDPRKLNFGSLAAEQDISTGLKEYFVESESFRSFAEGRKYIALGNRGSGKSAIFKMLGERMKAKDNIVVELAPEDYSYEMLTRAISAENRGNWAKHGSYAAAWKYLLYVMAMKAATSEGPRLKTGGAARIYEYLRDKHQGLEMNPIAALISYAKRLEGFKIGNWEVGMKTRQLDSLYRLEEIAGLMPALNEISRTKGIYLLVDELDKGWDGSEDAKAFVSGLFQAAVSINQRTPGLHVLISLRRELYENIPGLYDDAQKVRDFIEVVEWDEPQLLELVSRRIAHSMPELREPSAENRWTAIFSDTLEFRGTKSFNYMVDRTLYRPRELIQLCIGVRDLCVRIGLPATYQTVSEAEHSYSQARGKDIAQEYRFQYPDVGNVFETFRGHAHTFDRPDLEFHCLRLTTGDIKLQDAASRWVLDQTPEFLIDVLWRVGFLRAQAVGGIKARRRSGSSYLGAHQVENLNLASIGRFHVHPMFRSYLGLKEGKKTKADDNGDE